MCFYYVVNDMKLLHRNEDILILKVKGRSCLKKRRYYIYGSEVRLWIKLGRFLRVGFTKGILKTYINIVTRGLSLSKRGGPL